MIDRDYLKFEHSSVKLVIGNGFDLHCDLHSSFGHYYKFRKERIERIRNWYENFKSEYKKSDFDEFINLNDNDDFIKLVNIWDLFFVILACERNGEKFDKYLWSDVEKDIKESLIYNDSEKPKLEIKKENTRRIFNPILWEEVFVMHHALRLSNSIPESALCYIIRKKMGRNCIFDRYAFYGYLLDELKKFEKDFALFLNYQLVDTSRKSYGITIYNEKYFKKAIQTIKDICNLDSLVAIDTFNYTYIKSDELNADINYINGDINNPIFGIDSIFSPSKTEFTFTKTSRRMTNKNFISENKNVMSFKYLIIYGHSLNEADYSYFFPLFDQMALSDNTASSKVIFAFSPYGGHTEAEILENTSDNLFKMFAIYAKEKGLTKRFLDSLTTQHRVLFYKVPPLDGSLEYHNLFDDRWEEIEKK